MKFSGELLAILAALFIGIANPIGVQASKEIGAFQTTVYANLISAVFLLLFSLLIREKIQLKKSMTKHLKEMMSITFSRSVFGSLLLFYGFSLSTAMHSVFMLRLEPIFVTIFSYILLKERVKSKQIILISIMVFGAFLLSTSADIAYISQAQIGDLLIILSLLFFGYSYIPIKKIEKEINAMTVIIFNNLISGVILLALSPFLSINLLTINISNLWLLIGYVVFFSIIGLYFYFAALEKTRPWIVSSLLSIASIVGAFVAYFWLNEILNIIQIFGCLLIILSSYFIVKK